MPFMRQVEDEVLLKSAHWKSSQSFQPLDPGIVGCPAPRVLHQLQAGFIDGDEVPLGQFHTSLLAEVNELLEKIESCSSAVA